MQNALDLSLRDLYIYREPASYFNVPRLFKQMPLRIFSVYLNTLAQLHCIEVWLRDNVENRSLILGYEYGLDAARSDGAVKCPNKYKTIIYVRASIRW